MDPRRRDAPFKWLCVLCAGTMAGVSLDVPEQFGGRIGDVLKAISYVGNSILQEIKTKTEKS